MARRARLDAELVRRELARSRDHAQELITDGRVFVLGQAATKAATQVAPNDPILVSVADDDPGYASRGAHKLVGALGVFAPRGLDVSGRVCLDAGASTGGFTDVLLRAGAKVVVAVDVGYGQLVWRLQSDPRVLVLDRTNVRRMQPGDLPESLAGVLPDLVVADLSFISLALVLQPLRDCSSPDTDFVLMVKPQFEVGRERLGSGGVVRDPELRADAVRTICERAWTLGLGVNGVTASPLPGPSGNVEYFVWLRAGSPPLDPAGLNQAIEEGPQ